MQLLSPLFNMGKHLSLETREKISKARTGKKHSEETLRKMSLSHMGDKPSDETRAKMRKAKLGAKNHMHGKCMSEESRAKMSISHTGLTQAAEHKAKISRSLIGNTRSAGSCNHTQPHSEETKALIGAINSVAMQEKWNDPEFKDKRVRAIIKGCQIQPNIPELKLQAILDELYPSEWKYTGDGEIIIGGKNPDFTNVNGKKEIVEMYGDFWHRGGNPQDRINHYKSYGFRCLVIWENELGNTEILSEKISNFCK